MDKRYGKVKWGKGNPRQRTSVANWKLPVRWNDAPFQLTEDQNHRRTRVFCSSLADWLDDEVPIEWLADLLQLICDTPDLDWLLLTKRPQNFESRLGSIVNGNTDAKTGLVSLSYSWLHGLKPHNVWVGTSIENQETSRQRIPLLLQIPAKVRFLSVEPMLGPITLLLTKPMPIHDDVYGDQHEYYEVNAGIHWVIVGGESGSKKRPFNCEWARSIRAQCEEYSIPFFFKQVDKVQPIPTDLLIRQFPAT